MALIVKRTAFHGSSLHTLFGLARLTHPAYRSDAHMQPRI